MLPWGKAIRADGGCLAGSALSMDRAVAGFAALGGATLPDALLAATRNPARLLDSPDICRSLLPGQPANLFRFRRRRGEIEVLAVWAAGMEVYARP